MSQRKLAKILKEHQILNDDIEKQFFKSFVSKYSKIWSSNVLFNHFKLFLDVFDSCLAYHQVMSSALFLKYISRASISFDWCLDGWHKEGEDNLIIFTTETGFKSAKLLAGCFLISRNNLNELFDEGILLLGGKIPE